MKRLLALTSVLAVVGVGIAVFALRPERQTRPWTTTDVWYHESDVASLGRTGRPQLVEFFHPD